MLSSEICSTDRVYGGVGQAHSDKLSVTITMLPHRRFPAAAISKTACCSARLKMKAHRSDRERETISQMSGCPRDLYAREWAAVNHFAPSTTFHAWAQLVSQAHMDSGDAASAMALTHSMPVLQQIKFTVTLIDGDAISCTL